MIWIGFLPTIASALLLAVVPGLLVSLLLGARGMAAWALAGPVGITLISGSAVIAGLLQLEFSLWALLVASAAACLLSLAFRNRKRGVSNVATEPARGRAALKLLARNPRGLWTLGFLLLAGAVIFWRMITIFGNPGSISQTFDDIYHLNSVRYIVDSGNGSSLTVGQLVDPQNQWAMYPAAWHDYVALVSQLAGSAIPEAINAANLVICCVLWPAGAVFLVDSIVGVRTAARALTAVGAAGFSQFPYLMVDFGVLYPTLLATAALPAVLAVLITAIRNDQGRDGKAIRPWMLFAVALTGLMMAHPSSLLALLAFGLPWLAVRWFRWFSANRADGFRGMLYPLLAALGSAISIYFIWKYMRPDPASATWAAHQTLARAFGEALTGAAMGRPMPIFFSVLVIVGLYSAYRDRKFGRATASFVIGIGLYVVVSGMAFGRFRSFVAGGWYNDSYRIAALMPIVTLPLAVVGGLWLLSQLRSYALRDKRLRLLRLDRTHGASLLLPLVLLAGTVAVTQFRTVGIEVGNAARNFQLRTDSPLLSTDEHDLLLQVPQFVPEGETVIGSPWTGASLVYAYTGRPALLPHTQGTPGPDAEIVMKRLNRVDSDPAVCEALRRINSRHVLDFGDNEVHGGAHKYPGLENLDAAPGIEQVARVGKAILYRVSACDE
ncbi:DUF6541 family protein [Arthrobacter rhizosphaerae]|uniref:DUF6541 family protein n=1 Tax=Arthrobacter rhizosphaerae TaxID=2855490 RepID=UPI001FF33485|nr:DUF6541 family protein [Arthrobacter rhizosphaerae]